MKKFMIGLFTGSLLLTSISTLACDEHPHHRGGSNAGAEHQHRHERMLNHLEEQLGLSAEQVTAIAEIYEAREAQIKAFKQDTEPKDHHYLAQLDPNASTYDADVIEAAEQRAINARQKTLLMAKTMAKVDEVLTPEQRDKMALIRNEMRERKQARKAECHKS